MEAYFCPEAVDAHVTVIVLLLQPVCNELLRNTESNFQQLFGIGGNICVHEENK